MTNWAGIRGEVYKTDSLWHKGKMRSAHGAETDLPKSQELQKTGSGKTVRYAPRTASDRLYKSDIPARKCPDPLRRNDSCQIVGSL